MPLAATVADQQELLVNVTQDTGTITFDGNGATVYGAPSSMQAGDSFMLKFDLVMQFWYCVSRYSAPAP